MKSNVSTAVILGGLLLLCSVYATAHHSTPPYWRTDQSIEIEGAVKQMKVINPHSELILTVTNANGQPEDWIGVAGTGNRMIKAGWANETLAMGTKVRVVGAPPRREGAKGILIREIILEDGTVLTSGGLPQ